MDINFEYYKIFYYVAKYRNITKAAAALGSNQPNVTRVMKLLEAQLSAKLFIREARGISLTEAGELLYSHVEIACSHLLNAQEELCGQNNHGYGTVEIGTTETALHLFLLDALLGFKKKYPAIKIKIHNHTTPETIRQLTNGKLDFAVVTSPFAIPKAVHCEKILDFQEILVGGTQYRNLSQAELELKDLKDYPWVGLGRGTATYELYKNFFIEHKIDLEPDMEVATSDLLLPLIINNLGIGFVPETLALPFLKEGQLVPIPIRCKIPGRSLQMVSDQERSKSLAADTLYQYFKALTRRDISPPHLSADRARAAGIPSPLLLPPHRK